MEFTATCDLANPAIRTAYENKIIFDYPLAKFYGDRYSKDIITLRSDLTVMERALQALVLSQYRLKVFQDHRLGIKPVVLFKAAKIADSKDFMAEFIETMRKLTGGQLQRLSTAVNNEVMHKAFAYFANNGISFDTLAAELRDDFSEEHCVSVNDDTMTSEQWEHFAGDAFTGFDTDRTMLRISAMNLMLHSISHPEIDYKDSVSKQNQISDKFTMCLANPPFKGTVDAESIHDNLKAVTNTKKTELLFLALFLRMLRKGGQCACIVPDGVLFGASKAHKAIRKELVENHQLRAVISMPSGVFKPYAGVSTAVLVFTKTGAGGTENVWFYDMKADGFSLDDKRSEVEENDIPDIIKRFHHLDQEADRQRTEQSFLVPKQEIADNDYDLSINKYKKVEYVPVEYPSTAELMADLHDLELEITAGLAELEEML